MIDFKLALRCDRAAREIIDDMKCRIGFEKIFEEIDNDTIGDIRRELSVIIYRHMKGKGDETGSKNKVEEQIPQGEHNEHEV